MQHHIVKHWVEWELINGSPQAILVVATDLPTTPYSAGFDSSDFDDLANRALKLPGLNNLHISRLRIVPHVGLQNQ
jgi:hypothetical protein